MSAEKCGKTTSFIVEVSAKPAEEEAVLPEEAKLGWMAVRMLKKIRHKYPNFYPTSENEVWFKAHQMGLTEEE